MKNVLFLVVFFFLYSLSMEGQYISGTIQRKLDSIFSDWTQSGMPGGVAGIVEDGKLVWANGYGLSSLEYDVPVSTGTVFNIASVSKQFTAFSVVLLSREGKLSLEDDIRKYFPELPDFGSTITIRHLLNHTSGMRNFQSMLSMAGWRSGESMTNDDLLRYMIWQKELNFPPGSEYLYCNTGFNLLAQLVERISGQSFTEWTREHIFQPLGMQHSEFRKDLWTIRKNTATSYNGSADDGFHRSRDYFSYYGNGNLYTTVSDLAKWVANFSDHKVGDEEIFKEMTRRGILTSGDTISYALGLNVGEYRGLPRIQHGGSVGGYRSRLMYFPEQKTGIIVLSNFSSSGSGRKAEDIADLFLASDFKEPKTAVSSAPVIKRKAVPIDQKTLDKCSGTYLSNGDLVKLFREKEQFFAQPLGGPRFTVFASSDSTFFMKENDITFIAHREADGSVNRLTIYSPNRRRARRIDDVMMDPEILMEYTGEYYSPELKTTYFFTLEGNNLKVHHHRHEDFVLIPVEKDELISSTNFFSQISVVRDEEENVSGMRVSNGRVRDLWFEKVGS